MIRILNMNVPVSAVALALADAALLYCSITLGLLASYATIGEALAGGQNRQVVFILVMLISLFAMGLYHRQSLLDFSVITTRILIATSISFIALNTFFYLLPSTRIWISALLPTVAFSIVSLTAVRMLARRLFDLSRFKRRVLILGTGRQAEQIELAEQSTPVARFQCVGFVRMGGDAEQLVRPPLILPADDLLAICQSRRVDEIVLALDDRRGRLPLDLLLHLRLRGVPVLDAMTFFERETGRVEVDLMRPSWLILSDGSARGWITMTLKRTFDIAVSVLLFVATLPLMVVTALAILI